MTDDELIERVTELARDIEHDFSLNESCSFDVIRYVIEDKVRISSAVAMHRRNHTPCRRSTVKS